MQTNPSEKCDVCESYRGNPPPHVCVNSQLRPRSDSQPVVPEWEETHTMAAGECTPDARVVPVNIVHILLQFVRNATLEQAAEAVGALEEGEDYPGTSDVTKVALALAKKANSIVEDAQTTIRQLKSK